MEHDASKLLIPDGKKPEFPQILKVGGVLLLLVISGSMVWYTIGQFQQGKVQEGPSDAALQAVMDAEVARMVAEAEAQPFVYTVIPNAREAITLPPPPESNDTDAASYAKQKPEGDVAQSTVETDVAFYLPFMGTTYGEYLNELQNTELFQIHDELRFLTLHFNELYKRDPLSVRIEGVTELQPLESAVSGKTETHSVYPSIRAVEAYTAAAIMAQLDPENKEGHEELAEALVQRGIGYGLYGQSDADAAKDLVGQYFTLLAADATATQRVFTPTAITELIPE